MITDIGEYVVGAYLKLILKCDFIDYNVRPPGGGLKGLEELDVLGLDFKSNTAYLCEVTTHIRGILYKNQQTTLLRIAKKHRRQKEYARKYLKSFSKIRYMFWSPVVPVGSLTRGFKKMKSLELFINGKYKNSIEEMRSLAATTAHDSRNPFFRMLQIIEHLRE